MKSVSVYDLRTNLATYLDLVDSGEKVVVRRFKKPVAMMVPVDEEKMDYKRFFGFMGKGGETGEEFVNRVRRSKIELERVARLRNGRI